MVPELVEVKSPMADESFANEVYNMSYAKGHRAVNDLELPILTDGHEPHGLSFFRCHFPSMIIPIITNP